MINLLRTIIGPDIFNDGSVRSQDTPRVFQRELLEGWGARCCLVGLKKESGRSFQIDYIWQTCNMPLVKFKEIFQKHMFYC